MLADDVFARSLWHYFKWLPDPSLDLARGIFAGYLALKFKIINVVVDICALFESCCFLSDHPALVDFVARCSFSNESNEMFRASIWYKLLNVNDLSS